VSDGGASPGCSSREICLRTKRSKEDSEAISRGGIGERKRGRVTRNEEGVANAIRVGHGGLDVLVVQSVKRIDGH
jgi:hypothetical protein